MFTFYIFPTKDYSYKIVPLWGSLITELICIHKFQCEFRKYLIPEQMAVVMGGTFLLNDLFFKKGAHKSCGHIHLKPIIARKTILFVTF